jgi:hypothetical protein
MQQNVDVKNNTIAEKVLNNFKEGLEELKSLKNGTLVSKPIEDLLDELKENF